jgi:hypothetical protein
MSVMFNSAALGRSHRALHQAWWSLLLFPVSFVVAFVVGEGIPAWLGYSQPSLDSTPWWVVTVAVVPALLLFAAPLLVTAHFSGKAVAGGEPGGRLPVIVAAAVVGGFVALNLLGGLAQLIF